MSVLTQTNLRAEGPRRERTPARAGHLAVADAISPVGGRSGTIEQLSAQAGWLVFDSGWACRGIHLKRTHKDWLGAASRYATAASTPTR
ncbi:hypothetical protein GCM10023114_08320 [Mycolicibacterium sediminis]|uniref:Uncharacterized protein n=1 Tax=Mycolicibacterium sediminis TaxID=1286180 RepID=A0A7I7QSM6_9MYCO|nr:hypothetical protein MSEDJ_34000 [Mycolicibacterium sediminis]